ncbi:hypothetical protein A2W24_03020 [Microgenomates group bacterium RBG_16_45_19]|nr:MAG: hypothetical protein A2W24_03020 [Microgenomates group bacterium RBG_16_45_19]
MLFALIIYLLSQLSPYPSASVAPVIYPLPPAKSAPLGAAQATPTLKPPASPLNPETPPKAQAENLASGQVIKSVPEVAISRSPVLIPCLIDLRNCEPTGKPKPTPTPLPKVEPTARPLPRLTLKPEPLPIEPISPLPTGCPRPVNYKLDQPDIYIPECPLESI